MRNGTVNEEIIDKIVDYHNSIMCKRNLIICINLECAVNSVKAGDVYYARYLPTDSDQVRKILRRYQAITRLSTEIEDDTFSWFYNIKVIEDGGFGFSDNRVLKVQILGDPNLHNILANEYFIITEEQLNKWLDSNIYNFIKFHNPSKQENPDNKLGFTFLDEEQKDIFGAAILDGASPSDAWAVSIGMDVNSDELNINALDGFFTLKDTHQLERKKTRLSFVD